MPKDASEGAENEEEEQQEDAKMDKADGEADDVDKAERAAATVSTPAPWFWPRYPERMRYIFTFMLGIPSSRSFLSSLADSGRTCGRSTKLPARNVAFAVKEAGT